jgi:8-oxo-dGTP pyrophosphatase MutT (NUDIX family)
MNPAPDSSAPPPPKTAAGWLERFPVLRPPVSVAGAAVMIVLRDGSSGVETLLIERATNPQDPASGDVALPGGGVEDGDGSLSATALRELREEVGLGAADLTGAPRFVNAFSAPRFGLKVAVFAAGLAAHAPAPTIGSPSEVAHVFWFPAGRLAESRLVTRETGRGPIEVLATVHDGHVLWGFTRRILKDFFETPAVPGKGGPDPA